MWRSHDTEDTERPEVGRSSGGGLEEAAGKVGATVSTFGSRMYRWGTFYSKDLQPAIRLQMLGL